MSTFTQIKGRDAEWIRHVGAARARTSHMSLTRRGRFVFFGLPVLSAVVVLAVALMMFLVPGTAQAGTENAASTTQSVVVGSGDTLWDIARDVDSSADVRVTMDKINDLNDLGSGQVTPGQRLIVPIISE